MKHTGFKHLIGAQDNSSINSSDWFMYDMGKGYIEQEGYHMSNLALIYNDPEGKWSLTGYKDKVLRGKRRTS